MICSESNGGLVRFRKGDQKELLDKDGASSKERMIYQRQIELPSSQVNSVKKQ